MSHITTAGNVEVPAYLTLLQLGFQVERRILDNGAECWIARRDGEDFSGQWPLEVLGLCLMRQTGGSDWKATNEEIDAYLREYHPDALPPDGD